MFQICFLHLWPHYFSFDYKTAVKLITMMLIKVRIALTEFAKTTIDSNNEAM